MPNLCLAQVPSYVTPDGLIGWFPLDGSLESGIPGIPDGQLNGPTHTTDRFEVQGGALGFDGVDDQAIIEHYPEFENLAELTISIWLNPSEYPSNYATCGGGYGATYALVSKWASTTPSRTFLVVLSDWGPGSSGTNPAGYLQICNNSGGNAGCFQSASYATFPLSSWTHLAVTMGSDSTIVYVNGTPVFAGVSGSTNGSLLHSSNGIFIGNEEDASSTCPRFYDGQLDDLGFWNRALTPNEINSLYTGELPVFGCADSTACNFDSLANSDDGTCMYGCLYCGDGTVWDSNSSTCIVANPTDTDLDGCTGVSDVLDVLSTFGQCYTSADTTANTNGTCVEPVNYHGYEYATVQIGDQCWFAENLRTTVYGNGDAIPAGLTDGEWSTTSSGATAVYGEDDGCNNYSPDIDACDEAQSLGEYGRLYNWYAVDDPRGLCPTGWHVPTDEEWTDLENHIGLQGFSGTEGTALKSTYGWSNGGNGTDDFGFSALPGSLRSDSNGFFSGAGGYGYWWSSSPSGGNAWGRDLLYNNPDIYRDDLNPRYGFSVRCLRDAD
ncbi:hypothetical protein N9L83_00150 [Flavobacteriales bacterium]|nr:hypothetical protein [Flavobacteriales bacterium]